MKKRLLFVSFVFMFSLLMVSAFSLSDLFSNGITGNVVRDIDDLSEVAIFGKASVTNGWAYVSFSNGGFSDAPVVIAKPVSYMDGDGGSFDPAHVRIKDVTSTGFRMKIEEWNYSNGHHTIEKISYLAIEEGVYNLNGKQIVAGLIDPPTGYDQTDGTYTSNGGYVTFGSDGFGYYSLELGLDSFDSGDVVVLLTQSQTNVSTTPIVTRNKDVTNRHFRVLIQEEEEALADDEYPVFVGYSSDTSSSGNRPFDPGHASEETCYGGDVGWENRAAHYLCRDSESGDCRDVTNARNYCSGTGCHDTDSGWSERTVTCHSSYVRVNGVKETVGFVMAEEGFYDFGSTFLEVKKSSGHNDADKQIDFGSSFTDAVTSASLTANSILFLADMQTSNDMNTSQIRYKDLDTNSVEIFIEEEKSFDDEVSHANEEVGYFVFGTGVVVADTGTGVCSGEKDYFVVGVTGNGTTGFEYLNDTCSDEDTLTEYYCDVDNVVSEDFACNCMDDAEGNGYCEVSGVGDGRVCEAINIYSIKFGPAGADSYFVVNLSSDSDPIGVTVDLHSEVSDIISVDIWTKLNSGTGLVLKLLETPVKSRAENEISDVAGDLSYYCGIDLIWDQMSPTLRNLDCIEARDNCGRENFRDNYPDITDPYSNTGTDDQDISACLIGEGCSDFDDSSLYPDPFVEIDKRLCLENYECQSNSCVDDYCVSITEELKTQRGFLIRIWCVVATLPTYLGGDREDTGGQFGACLANPFGGG